MIFLVSIFFFFAKEMITTPTLMMTTGSNPTLLPLTKSPKSGGLSTGHNIMYVLPLFIDNQIA